MKSLENANVFRYLIFMSRPTNSKVRHGGGLAPLCTSYVMSRDAVKCYFCAL